MPCTGMGNKWRYAAGKRRRFGMGEKGKSGTSRRRNEAVSQLRKLAQWRTNDAVKLAYFGEKNLRQIKGLDLAGITELKRHANGAIEMKFIDKVRVFEMIGELLDRQDDRELNRLLDELGTAESGDGQ